MFVDLFQSAKGVCKLGEVLGESLSSHQHILLESVMKEVPGRLWEVGIFFLQLLEEKCWT